MAKLVVTCPSCQGELRATRLACQACGTNLDGSFDLPLLLRLPVEDVDFITEFVLRSGSLKAMASLDGTSYPTVRNRLDQIIGRLDTLLVAARREAAAAAQATKPAEDAKQKRRHEILDALEKGRLSAKEAEEQLRKVGL